MISRMIVTFGILLALTWLPALVHSDELAVTYKASQVIGQQVRDQSGAEIGDVEEVLLDPFYGRVAYAQVSVGGFLGIGDRHVLIPWRAFTISKVNGKPSLTLNVSREHLEKAPALDADRRPDTITPDYALVIHRFYDLEPYWSEGQTARAGTARQMFPDRYNDFYQVTARNGYLVGGEGNTGDSMRYDGSMIWEGPGQASVVVRDQDNNGLVMGTVRTHGHTYTVVMTTFKGEKPFMDGGIATDLFLHGTSGHGAPVLPFTWAPIAGWGKATVFKDDDVLYKNFEGHFMLTTAVRNESSYKVDFLDPERVEKLIVTKEDIGGQGDKMSQAEVKATRQAIEEKAAVNPNSFQLHILALSPKKNPEHLPPHEQAVHFMFNEITWH